MGTFGRSGLAIFRPLAERRTAVDGTADAGEELRLVARVVLRGVVISATALVRVKRLFVVLLSSWE